MQSVSFETLFEVKEIVDELVPGYYRCAVNPFEALENQQGNCFTNAVIGAVALSELYEVEASLAWSSKEHAKPTDDGPIKSVKSDKKLHIQHIELVVPRNINRFDILSLAYGFRVITRKDGSPYEKQDLGGEIKNYNFEYAVPNAQDTRVENFNENDDPWLEIIEGGEIVPTPYGRELGLEAMDWQHAADEYLLALEMQPLDYDALTEMFLAKYTAMKDWQETQPRAKEK